MFVIKLPLIVSQRDARRLKSSLELARMIYNSFLRECERRRKLYANHPACLQARELRGPANKPARIALYNQARNATGYYWRSAGKKHGLDDSLEQYIQQVIVGNSFLCQHFCRHEVSELGKRAFKASRKVAIRLARKVHFKARGKKHIHSVAGTSLNSAITWIKGKLRWGKRFLLSPQAWCFEDEKNKAVLAQFAQEEKEKLPKTDRCISQVRLVRKLIKGVWQYYAYLVVKGVPVKKEKHTLGTGKIGLDLGPSKLAYVAENTANGDGIALLEFCAQLDDMAALQRRLARKLDRQRRANNPDNFHPDGSAKEGRRTWKTTRAMRSTALKLAEVKRKQAEYRRCLHGRLVNILRSLGDHVLFEDLSYKAWQRGRYGKAVGAHAPGTFITLLKQKFAYTDGMVDELDAHALKLSQRCPNCGKVQKKKLRQRTHDCECGYVMQRDLVSALLAICADTDGEWKGKAAKRAKKLSKELDPLLSAAWEQDKKVRTKKLRSRRRRSKRRRSRTK